MSIDSGECGLLMMQDERLPDAALAALMSSGADLAFLQAQGEPLSLDLLFAADGPDELVFPKTDGGAAGGDGTVPLVTASSDGDPDGDDDGDGIPNKDDPDSVIVVIGKRPRTFEPNPGTDVGGGDSGDGGSGGTPPPPPQSEDCQKDGQALKITEEVNRAGGDGNERGSVVYKDSTGKVVSTPVATGSPGTVAVILPSGVTWSQVIGFVHSHPLAPRSGDDALDAMYDAADRYPSPDDWDQMDRAVAGGADPSKLSFYVIDKDGVVREYNYSDKSVYDVSEEKLLGSDGPPPPVPAPLSGTGCA